MLTSSGFVRDSENFGLTTTEPDVFVFELFSFNSRKNLRLSATETVTGRGDDFRLDSDWLRGTFLADVTLGTSSADV